MDPQATTLMLENTFFVFTENKGFIVPRAEYESIQPEGGFLSVKRSSLSAEAGCDNERVLCILCHEETKPEDMVSPLCRAMHFVICRECVQDIKERKNRVVVECPFCREKTSKKEYHSEIMETVFSLRAQQTLLGLEVRPDMEIESVAELTLNSKVVLCNISISDRLFLLLISRTKMDIRGRISLFGHSNTSICCRAGLANETSYRIYICTNEYNKEEVENTKTVQKRRINIEARRINVKEKRVCILLKHCTVDACYCSLGITEKKYIEEILGDENPRAWSWRVGNLKLRGYAVNLLPKLVENQVQELSLSAYSSGHITTILETEDRSVWVGKVRALFLDEYAVETLPKLEFHEENVMEELHLCADDSGQISRILKAEDRSVWVGKA
ncbi:MAG: uncharacterized protein A8A55_2746, partial [Amphiamblys sp. WSBS2006]